jgi:peptidoglycan/LPS O-acetylase OafA/YrhL
VTTSPNRQYLPAVDHLRCFAALLVMFYHGFELLGAQLAEPASFDGPRDWVHTLNPFVALVQEGHSGVSLFIVLSGFILSLGTIDKGISYFKFIWARVLRLYPLLIVCLAAAVFAKPWGSVSLYTIFISLIPISVAGNLQSVFTTMFWAVTIEFQCYLLFPFAMRLGNAYGVKALVSLILFTLALRFGVYWLQGGGSQRDLSYASIFGRFDQFLMGMIAARLHVSGKLAGLRSVHWLGAAGLVLVSMLAFNQAGGAPTDGYWRLLWPTYEAAMWALFIATYFHAPLNPKYRLSAIAAKMGEISYSSYLWHFAILTGVINMGLFLHITGPPHGDAMLTTAFIVLPTTLAVALISHQFVELPFLNLRPRYVLPRPAETPLAPVAT